MWNWDRRVRVWLVCNITISKSESAVLDTGWQHVLYYAAELFQLKILLNLSKLHADASAEPDYATTFTLMLLTTRFWIPAEHAELFSINILKLHYT